MTAATIDGSLCQVCGDPVLLRAVRCVSCETIHHEECFVWSGGCSTYACGSAIYWRGRGEKREAGQGVEGVALALEEARPPAEPDTRSDSTPVVIEAAPVPHVRVPEVLAGLAALVTFVASGAIVGAAGVSLWPVVGLALCVAFVVLAYHLHAFKRRYVVDPARGILLLEEEASLVQRNTRLARLDEIVSVGLVGRRASGHSGAVYEFWLSVGLSSGGMVTISDATSPVRSWALLSVGLTCWYAGDRATARKWFERVRESHPGSFDAEVLTGWP